MCFHLRSTEATSGRYRSVERQWFAETTNTRRGYNRGRREVQKATLGDDAAKLAVPSVPARGVVLSSLFGGAPMEDTLIRFKNMETALKELELFISDGTHL